MPLLEINCFTVSERTQPFPFSLSIRVDASHNFKRMAAAVESQRVRIAADLTPLDRMKKRKTKGKR